LRKIGAKDIGDELDRVGYESLIATDPDKIREFLSMGRPAEIDE